MTTMLRLLCLTKSQWPRKRTTMHNTTIYQCLVLFRLYGLMGYAVLVVAWVPEALTRKGPGELRAGDKHVTRLLP